MARKRRSFTPEYKAEVVGLVRDGGESISAVARDLGLTESAVRNWVSRSDTDAGLGDGKVLATAEREELSQLRRENRRLRMEREILKNPRSDAPLPVVIETRLCRTLERTRGKRPLAFWWSTPTKNVAQGLLRTCCW